MSVQPDKPGPHFYVLQEQVRILFVDDDPILREFAVVNLSSETATIETASDGDAAIAKIEASAPDVVLLDLDSPTSDGFEVLKALRADPRRLGLPVIVVTGREDLDAVERAFEGGATSFVVKPLNWRLLAQQIRYVVRTARAAERLAAQGAEATRKLQALAAEGARFFGEALPSDPSLKAAALAFAEAAGAALDPKPADDERKSAEAA